MIEHEQAVAIGSDINDVWAYVSDMQRWAVSVPGCKDCDVINSDRSIWTIRAGAGALIKTVKVNVLVEEWKAPTGVRFRFDVANEPVTGDGSYSARATDSGSHLVLVLRIIGSGPMAPVWETLGKAIVPALAASFVESLRLQIEAEYPRVEKASAGPAMPCPKRSRWQRLVDWLRGRRPSSKRVSAPPAGTH